nr:unnamed protein product [Callosobruchus analis]
MPAENGSAFLGPLVERVHLQHRTKWKKNFSQKLKVGTLVLVKEDGLPPLKWRIGRITKLHPGADSNVRAVTLKTWTGEYKRPVDIISDLFPGVAFLESDYRILNKAVEDACAASNLQCTQFFLEKVQQLYEMILVRHGLMIVGLPFAGKTSCYRILAAALALIEERVSIYTFYQRRSLHEK